MSLETMFSPAQWAGCVNKNAYGSEALARDTGQRRFRESGTDLYVYKCGYCKAWHLTKKERSEYWHVQTPASSMDDFTDLLGDVNFWDRLVDMPHSEAEKYLRQARRSTYIAMVDGSYDEARLMTLQSRLKDEIHFISQIGSRQRVLLAVQNLYGLEVAQAVKAEVNRLNRANEVHEYSTTTENET